MIFSVFCASLCCAMMCCVVLLCCTVLQIQCGGMVVRSMTDVGAVDGWLVIKNVNAIAWKILIRM